VAEQKQLQPILRKVCWVSAEVARNGRQFQMRGTATGSASYRCRRCNVHFFVIRREKRDGVRRRWTTRWHLVAVSVSSRHAGFQRRCVNGAETVQIWLHFIFCCCCCFAAYHYSPNSTCLATSRHDTLSSTCILARENVVTWRDVSCLRDSMARHARHKCSGESPQRGLGLTCPPHFFRSCSRNWCKSRAQKTKPLHASTTASSSFTTLEQARLETLVTTRTAHTSRRTCHVVSWRAKCNLSFLENFFVHS